MADKKYVKQKLPIFIAIFNISSFNLFLTKRLLLKWHVVNRYIDKNI